MRTLEELKQYYDSTLMPVLLKLEANRKKVLLINIIAFSAIILMTILFITTIKYSESNELLLKVISGFLMISILGGIGLSIYYRSKYIASYKSGVIRRIVSFIDPGFNFNDIGFINSLPFINSNLFLKHPDEFESEDYVYGRIGDTELQFAEVHAQEVVRRTKKRTEYRTIFRGLLMEADFNKNFNGKTIVLPDLAQKLLGALGQFFQSFDSGYGDLVKLENPEFEKLFVVYSSDQIEARYILTPGLMDRIVDFRNKTGRKIYISFVDSKVYVAIPYNKNLFEPRLFRTILDFSPVQEYFENLQLAIGVIEDFNLNTRIWGKE